MSSRRSLLKIISLSCLSWILYPYNFVLSETKKIINQNLTSKQKEIMFREGTERPFTSELLKEKEKAFIIVLIVETNYFHQRQSSIVALAGRHSAKLYQELLKLKLIIHLA